MPMKLNVGLSRKVGLPDYGSIGASCNLDVELDSTLLSHEPGALRARIREAYEVAHHAVREELERLRVLEPAGTADDRNNHTNGRPPQESPWQPAKRQLWGSAGPGQTRKTPTSKPSTPNQVRAILALARQAEIDLANLLREEHGVQRVDDLSRSEASALIDRLKAMVNS